MTSLLLDGKKVAKSVLSDIEKRVSLFKESYGNSPKIALIQVGENTESSSYLKSKHKKATKCGFEVIDVKLPNSSSQLDLKNEIIKLNLDENINGILLQLPLPEKLNEIEAIDTIEPSKDIDGLCSYNLGLLSRGEPLVIPCTTLGILKLVQVASFKNRETSDLSGMHVVMVGRSTLVGRPTAAVFEQQNCTITLCHSKTKDLAKHTLEADILIVAAGSPKLITYEMIKDDAIIIDVGLNYLDDGLCGDVDFENCSQKASAITPVPGGVGPMTIAMLMYNAITLSEKFVKKA